MLKFTATTKTFPRLRELRGLFELSLEDLGNVIDNSYQTYTSKLNLKSEFLLTDMVKLSNFFTEKGAEKATPNDLFFEWLSSNEENVSND